MSKFSYNRTRLCQEWYFRSCGFWCLRHTDIPNLAIAEERIRRQFKKAFTCSDVRLEAGLDACFSKSDRYGNPSLCALCSWCAFRCGTVCHHGYMGIDELLVEPSSRSVWIASTLERNQFSLYLPAPGAPLSGLCKPLWCLRNNKTKIGRIIHLG